MEKQSKEGICVAIRMRPLNDREISSGQEKIFNCVKQSNSICQLKDGQPLEGQTYYYDKVFDGSSITQDVYSSVAKDIVKGVVHGINGTIFAYGQTSSGKTHTMLGGGSERGVLDLSAEDIFRHIADSPNRDFLLRVSFVEIYNETIRDLLSDSLDTSVAIREDPRKGVYCEATEVVITDYESIIRALKKGISKRAVEATAMNDTSSRSHTIFKLVIESKESTRGGGEPDEAILVASLNLVDLAGSESVRHTGAIGQRAKEGGKINQSLLSLSRVIHALSQPGAHVSFRDSKLTRLLQPSLCGNAKMSVVCCITPADRYLEETRSTLQFASRAKLVTTNATVNEVLDDSAKLKRLQKELNELRERQAAGRGANVSEEEHIRMEAEKSDLLGKLQQLQQEKDRQQTQLERLRHLLVNSSGRSTMSRRSGVGLESVNLEADEEPRRKQRKKHRDTWCPGLGLSSDVGDTDFPKRKVLKSTGLVACAVEETENSMFENETDANMSRTSCSSSESGRMSSGAGIIAVELEEAQEKIRFLELELLHLKSGQTLPPSELASTDVAREMVKELEDEVNRKSEEIDSLVTERDQIFQQLEIEMGANAEHEAELQAQIETLTSQNKSLEMQLLTVSESAANGNTAAYEEAIALVATRDQEIIIQQEHLLGALAEVESLKAQLASKCEEVQLLTQQAEDAAASNAAHCHVIAELESQKEHLIGSESAACERLSEAEGTIQTLREELSAVAAAPLTAPADAVEEIAGDSDADRELAALRDHVTLLEEDLRVSSEFTDMLLGQIDELKASKSEVDIELARIEGEYLRLELEFNASKTTQNIPQQSAQDKPDAEETPVDTEPVNDEEEEGDEADIDDDVTIVDPEKTALVLVIRELEGKISSLTEEVSEYAETSSRLDGLESELRTMRDSLATVSQQRDHQLAEMVSMQSTIESLEQELTKADNANIAMEEQVRELSIQLELVTSKESLLTESIVKAEEEATEAKEQVAALESQLEGQVSDMDLERKFSSSLQTKVAGLEELTQQLQATILAQEGYQTRVEEQESAIENLRAEVAKHLETIRLLENSIEDHVHSIDSLRLAIATAEASAQSAKLTNDKLTQQVQQLQSSTQHQQMGMAQVDIDGARRDMDKAVQQVHSDLGKKEGEISRLMAVVQDLSQRAEIAENAVLKYQTAEMREQGDEDSIRRRLGQLQTTVDLLKGEKEVFARRITEFEKEKKSRNQEASSIIEKLEAQVQALQGQVAKFESSSSDTSRMLMSLKAMETRLADTKADREQLTASLAAADSRIDELESEISRLSTQRLQSSDSEALQRELKKAVTARDVALDAVARLESDLLELGKRMKKSKDEMSMLQSEVANLQQRESEILSEKETIVAQMSEEIRVISMERDEMTAEAEKALQQVSELTEALIEADSLNSAQPQGDSNAAAELEVALTEISELKAALEGAVNQYEESQREVAFLMGEIEKQDIVVNELQGEVADLSKQLSESEAKQGAEASDGSEQLLEELNLLMEAKLEAESQCSLAMAQTSALRESLAEREKAAAEEQEMFMKAAEIEMENLRTQASDYSQKFSALTIEMEELTSRDSQSLLTIQSLKKEVADKEDIIASIENEMFSMRQEMATGMADLAEQEALHSQLQKALNDCDSLHSTLKHTRTELRAAEENSKLLESKLEALRVEMADVIETKDKRIAHLDKHKITKDHMDMINKLKDERKKHQEDSKLMKKQLNDLKKAYESLRDAMPASGESSRSTRSAASASGTAFAPSIEIADLKSQLIETKSQLESAQLLASSLKNKLKECSKQLQEYESERSGVIDILIAQGIDVAGLTDESGFLNGDADASALDERANDLIVAVNKLVEKLSTTKAALVSMTAKASVHSSVSSSKAKDLEQRLEQALAEAEDLKCQRASLEKRLEALKAANKINREELAATQTEVEELKSRCEGLQVDVTRERLAFERLQAKQQSEPVVSPEVQALEEENLELMKENKELMKQAASYRAQSERLTAQLAKAQVQTQVSTSTPALPATGPIRSALEAPDSSKKRTFGTDIAKCIGNSENISKESKESPSLVSKETACKETGNASLLDVSASQHPEQKRSRVRAKAVVSTSSLTPSSGEAPCEAAPEEGCAQS